MSAEKRKENNRGSSKQRIYITTLPPLCLAAAGTSAGEAALPLKESIG